MAKQKKRSGTNKDLKQDSLIDKLVSDPSQPPDLIVLTGFLGKSATAGHVRLYLTPKLNDYFEIPEKDVINSQSLATESNPLGGTVVWVRRGAELVRTRTTPIKATTEFLGGPITNAFLAGTRMGGAFSGRAMLRFARASYIPCPWTDDPDYCFESFNPSCPSEWNSPTCYIQC